MGRRNRKLKRISRTTKRKGGGVKRFVLWSLVSLFSLLVLALLIGYFIISAYLSGDDFRHKLEQTIASKANVEKVTLARLNWGGASLGTDSIEAEGGDPLKQLTVGKLEAVVDRSAIFKQHLRIKELTIDKVDVDLVRIDDDRVKPAPGPVDVSPPVAPVAPQAEPRKSSEKDWFSRNVVPNRYSLDEAVVRNFSLSYTRIKDGESDLYSIKHVKAVITPELGDNGYKMTLQDGEISVPFDMVSVGNLKSAMVRYRDDRISVTDCRIVPNYGGHIDGEGEWEKPNSRWWATLFIRDVHCSNLVSPDWKKKVDGIVEGSLRLRGELGELVEASGRVQINKGSLTALPVLDTMAAFTRTSQFRTLSFNIAEANYQYASGVWRISNIILACDGLLRVEGWIEIRDDDSLSGRLQVGVVPGALSNIPGAEEKVFLSSSDPVKKGLLWANVNLSGTVDSPREDLTARLVAAAGDRLFQIIPETGQRVLLFSGDLAQRLLGTDISLPGQKKKDDREEDKEQPKNGTADKILNTLDTLDKAAGSLLGL